ncbi:basic proline-rich protein-like [Ochotona princeps]|uniref:basic proline-rich protein-like n=1 Tax=Ochotona princeps TaxID=9978 RepID=UPI002714699D|nr:basic proline-rich protein-like [Ochotona princeps]
MTLSLPRPHGSHPRVFRPPAARDPRPPPPRPHTAASPPPPPRLSRPAAGAGRSQARRPAPRPGPAVPSRGKVHPQSVYEGALSPPPRTPPRSAGAPHPPATGGRRRIAELRSAARPPITSRPAPRRPPGSPPSPSRAGSRGEGRGAGLCQAAIFCRRRGACAGARPPTRSSAPRGSRRGAEHSGSGVRALWRPGSRPQAEPPRAREVVVRGGTARKAGAARPRGPCGSAEPGTTAEASAVEEEGPPRHCIDLNLSPEPGRGRGGGSAPGAARTGGGACRARGDINKPSSAPRRPRPAGPAVPTPQPQPRGHPGAELQSSRERAPQPGTACPAVPPARLPAPRQRPGRPPGPPAAALITVWPVGSGRPGCAPWPPPAARPPRPRWPRPRRCGAGPGGSAAGWGAPGAPRRERPGRAAGPSALGPTLRPRRGAPLHAARRRLEPRTNTTHHPLQRWPGHSALAAPPALAPLEGQPSPGKGRGVPYRSPPSPRGPPRYLALPLRWVPASSTGRGDSGPSSLSAGVKCLPPAARRAPGGLRPAVLPTSARAHCTLPLSAPEMGTAAPAHPRGQVRRPPPECRPHGPHRRGGGRSAGSLQPEPPCIG